MPIYAYRCAACGHAQDVLQKMSDPVLTVCPNCGVSAYEKQVTAAGFQLKGSGWYVTDFRGGNSGAPAKSDAAAGETKAGDAKPAEGKAAEGGAKAAEPAKPAPAAAPGPAAPSTPK